MTTLVWFRQDLRIADNPALASAVRAGPIVPVFVLDEINARALGGASRWWLAHSLTALTRDLGALVLQRGDAGEIIPQLAQAVGAERVVWTRSYDEGARACEGAVKAALAKRSLAAESFNGALLFDPDRVKNGANAPFKVFTPFWRAAQRAPLEPHAHCGAIVLAPAPQGDRLEDWRLTDPAHDARGWDVLWRPGEAGAQAQLKAFLDNADGYHHLRDRPDRPATSRLSPHLRWGEISPRQVWRASAAALETGRAQRIDIETFLREIGWREFCCHLLLHFPQMATANWRRAFDAYPWRTSPADFEAWRTGMTGYPMVDAGMRELRATGFMHNRVRMIAASFLVKHLRIDWRAGEQWFWDALLDADPANNPANWQWVAGSGADAAPYFRIFNPIEQGRKFDPDGAYVRTWIPEIAALPNSAIHAPFSAGDAALANAALVLGKTYPAPLVDHKEARALALEGYARVKAAQDDRGGADDERRDE